MNKMNYTYQLEKGSRKFKCPKCGKKAFVRFIFTADNSYAKEEFGRCDRESKCGYFNAPNTDGFIPVKNYTFTPQISVCQEQYYIPNSTLNSILKGYDQNAFVQNLLSSIAYPMSKVMVMEVVQLYKVGTLTNGFMAGALCLPFISKKGDINAIQVKQFDNDNHTTKTNFLHAIAAKHYEFQNKTRPMWLNNYLKNDKIIRCLFGEHLLKVYPHNPIALVEAPKTALYASLYFGMPQCKTDFLWLAVFNKSSLSYNKFKVLAGRDVVLFPDLNAYEDWSNKASQIKHYLKGCHVSVSNYLEHNATDEDKQEGLDLGDYLIKYDWRSFRSQKKIEDKEKDVSKPKKEMKAYLYDEGQLYLKQPFMDAYTVYPDVESFVNRTCLPRFVSASEIKVDLLQEINLKS